MEKDVIRIADTTIVCEECGERIGEGELVNEFIEGDETMFYCMECVSHLVHPSHLWEGKTE